MSKFSLAYGKKWQITLASSYNLTRVALYFVCILFFPLLIIKSEAVSQKIVCSVVYVFLILFGTLAALPTIRRLLYAINLTYIPEDFLQVNQEEIVIPLNYLRPYKNKISNDLLHIPLAYVLKVCYLDQVARGQERHVLIHYCLPNSEENKLLLYNCEFINGQKDIDAFYEFFVGKVPIERMEFLR